MSTSVPRSLSSTEAPFAKRLSTASKCIFCAFVIFTLALLGLEIGVWETTETHLGPFVQDPASLSGRSVGFAIHGEHAFKCCVGLRSDNNEHPSQSDLRLWINEREMSPAHTQHELIRKGETTGFSNWAGYVILALPSGVQNDSKVKATVRYALRPIPGSTAVFALAASLLSVIAYRRRVLVTPHILLLALGYGGLVLSCLYLACTLFTFAAGWGLPTTALIRWSSIAQWMCRNESFLPYVLLACAGLGVVAAWFRPLFNLAATDQGYDDGAAFRRFFQRWGLFITACALIFSISGMWAGLVRLGDLSGFAIGGMIQFNDAAGHLTAAHDQAKDGVWQSFALRRPIAAAFRSTLLFFAGFSLPAMLLLQAFLLAGAICFASAAVTRWRGLWSGVTFFALTYICVRTFAPTTLSEPLGLLAALASIPFFIEAFRTGSVPAALLAFAFTTVALMTRMGSMFTIPALMLWLVWHFGTTPRERAKIGLLAIALITVFATMNYMLEEAYGNEEYLTGSNFSYTLCGLTMGTTYHGCLTKLAERMADPLSAGMEVKAAYSLAWENFSERPSVFFNRLLAGAHAFLTDVPNLVFRGYGAVIEPSWFPRTLIAAVSIIGVIHLLFRRDNRKQMGFWALFWASVVLSSAFVFFDQGQRVLASSYPLIFLFFAMGMTGPTRTTRRGDAVDDPKLLRFGIALLTAAVLLFFSIPWLAHRLSPAQSFTAGTIAAKPDEAVVFGGRRLAGFLVLPDEMPLRKETSSLHLSEFEAIVKQSNVETYQGLIHPEMPPLPFGFVFSPRLEKDGASIYQFIVPPEVMERREVQAWRLHVKRWQPESGGNWWLYVTRAEPLR